MKSYVAMDELEMNHLIEQLRKFGFTKTEGLTRRELIHKLSTCRALEVEIKSPHADWF